MNLHEKRVGIDPNNDSNYNSRHRSMTLDFDPFWMFKMIGDPKTISLVTPLEGGHQGVTKGSPKKTCICDMLFVKINIPSDIEFIM